MYLFIKIVAQKIVVIQNQYSDSLNFGKGSLDVF